MSEPDVEAFLWEVERHLSHVSGDERLKLVREAERLLHERAAELAAEEDAEDLTWYHYVQATADLGPAANLAADLTGAPLPVIELQHRRLWTLAASLGAVVLVLVAYSLLTQGELNELGEWTGSEVGLTERRELTFNVSDQARSVFLTLVFTPTTADGSAAVTVLDGGARLVHEDRAVLSDHVERAAFYEGASGTWRVVVDFQAFTGGWRVTVREQLPS